MKTGFIFVLICLVGGLCLSFAAEKSNSDKEKLNVVFVASNIQNAQSIVNMVEDEAIAVVYDFDETNLNLVNLTLVELAEWKEKKIDHVLFFCHGAPGNILLGADYSINLKSINQDADHWKFFSQQLSANAHIDFYGCEIGLGEEGEKLIRAISHLTKASVRASIDATGNIHDADWDLEAIIGENAGASFINFSELSNTPIYF